jgi:hypothetical protein
VLSREDPCRAGVVEVDMGEQEVLQVLQLDAV